MLEIPGVYMKNTFGAPFGDAVLAGVGTGVVKDFSVVKNWISVSEETKPIKENVQIYNKYFPVFKELYSRNRDLYKKVQTIMFGAQEMSDE